MKIHPKGQEFSIQYVRPVGSHWLIEIVRIFPAQVVTPESVDAHDAGIMVCITTVMDVNLMALEVIRWT